jgi:hypothetical protein
MRREVPDHVDIVLKQAQVDPHGVIVVELAEDTIFRTAPVKRKVWSTMIFRRLESASSMSSSASATVAVNGFSTKTCLPFASALRASSW